jgi:cyclophilin family peptidyl-prolyl cis-trans isomerase
MLSALFGNLSKTRQRSRNNSLRRTMSRSTSHYEQLESRSMLAVDLLGPLSNQVLAPDDPAMKIDLADYFDESDITGTVVQMSVNVPTGDETIYVELFDKPGAERLRTTPLTVDNFLNYVDTNAYDGSMIHRSVRNFVIQGGGFLAPTVPADQVGSDPQAITAGPNVVNEPGNENVRGTLAMAKVGGDPDSANSQWFVNLNDNRANLDSQNGGFTVFARILGSGMDTVDKMAAAVPYNAYDNPDTPEFDPYYNNPALNELPLWDVPASNILIPENFLTLQVDRGTELTYSITNSATNVVAASLDGTNLVLVPQGLEGVSVVTITATSIADPTASAELSFEVRVGNPLTESVFTLSSGARWLLSRSNGVDGFETSTFAQWNPGVTWINPIVGDFNGDGLTDVAARTHYGQWWAAINQGDGTTVNWRGSYWGTLQEWSDILVGDFDGDGRDDIAGRASTGAWFAAIASENNTFTNRLLTLWDANTTWNDVVAGDFNNDGKTDIAGRDQNGRWHVVSINAQDIASSSIAGSWTTNLEWSHVMPGDFNGDGRTDIAARASNGLWYAALSLDRATPVFSTTYMGAWAKIAWSDIQVGDFNGDGLSDILGRTAGGSWWASLARTDQPGFRNSYMGQWNPIAWAGVTVGDFNGDSRTDILGRVASSSLDPLWVGLSIDGKFSTSKWGSLGLGSTLVASFIGKA